MAQKVDLAASSFTALTSLILLGHVRNMMCIVYLLLHRL